MKGEQFELNLRKRPGVPIEYQFSQEHLKTAVRDEIRHIIGNADRLDEDFDILDIRDKIKVALSMRGLIADFQEDRVVIRAGKRDDTGEYWKSYEERQVG